MSSYMTSPSGGPPDYTYIYTSTAHHQPSSDEMWNMVRMNGEYEIPVSYTELIRLNGAFDIQTCADPSSYRPRSESLEVFVGSDKEDERDHNMALVHKVRRRGNHKHQTNLTHAGQSSKQPARLNANTEHDLSKVGCWAEIKASPADASELDGAHAKVRSSHQRTSQQRPSSGIYDTSNKGMNGPTGTGAVETWS